MYIYRYVYVCFYICIYIYIYIYTLELDVCVKRCYKSSNRGAEVRRRHSFKSTDNTFLQYVYMYIYTYIYCKYKVYFQFRILQRKSSSRLVTYRSFKAICSKNHIISIHFACSHSFFI